MKNKSLVILIVFLASLWGSIHFGNSLFRILESDAPSISHGTIANGSLENGKRLPTKGANFRSYSRLGSALGRTAVHHKVRDTVLEAYAMVRETHPELTFIVGETGWVQGGRIKPHKTHQNGLSVDFMVPVRDKNGGIARLSTTVLNKYGYEVEFDDTGAVNAYTIDYEAMAVHLDALLRAAENNGVGVDLVIFDPVLQPYVFETSAGRSLKGRVRFSTKRVWVRHDEHYHVDFSL